MYGHVEGYACMCMLRDMHVWACRSNLNNHLKLLTNNEEKEIKLMFWGILTILILIWQMKNFFFLKFSVI